MARFYSDHFSSDGSNQTSVDAQRRISAGLSHGRLRYKRSIVSAMDSANADEVRFAQFKSSDRIIELLLSGDGGGSAGTSNLGLYKSGSAHDGVVIDMDLFASDIDTTGVIARVDQFKESSTLTDRDRGKTLWELATVGAASYTSDPMEDWDLTGLMDAGSDAVLELVLEVYYTSGD